MTETATLVSDLMTKEVVTLHRNDEIALADDLMNLGRVRHIPVVDDDVLVGILTQRDLFRSALLQSLDTGSEAHDRALKGIQIKAVMTTDVITASPAMPLHTAAELMIKQKIGCLPVLLDGRLVGLLTETDFVRSYTLASAN